MEYSRHTALMRLVGLGGIDQRENATARRWGQRLEAPMVIAAIWILVDWYLGAKGVSHPYLTLISDWLIWLIFALELILMLFLVDDRARYLKQNWMSPLIVLAGLPILWGVDTFYAGILRTLRLALTVGILFRVSKDTRVLLSRHNLGATLIIYFIFLVIAGLLISGIDPAFATPMDGLWWAWVTVTTVGYGDVVPSTTEGRIFGSLLILVGLAMFSMLTASFSAFFIEQDEREIAKKEAENIARIQGLENRLQTIEAKLEKTLRSLDTIAAHTQPKISESGEGEEDKTRG